jgi:hypothetical protein
MDTFVAVFWLIGQALSIIALFLGLALSLAFAGTRISTSHRRGGIRWERG